MFAYVERFEVISEWAFYTESKIKESLTPVIILGSILVTAVPKGLLTEQTAVVTFVRQDTPKGLNNFFRL